MLKLRNPWGVEGERNKNLQNFGNFFELTFKEFLSYYGGTVHVCKYIPTWFMEINECKFDFNRESLDWEPSNFFKFTITEPTTVMLGMFGGDTRNPAVRHYYFEGRLELVSPEGFLVAQLAGKSYGGGMGFYRNAETDNELDLQPGEYCFTPRLQTADGSEWEGEINFSLYSDRAVFVEAVPVASSSD